MKLARSFFLPPFLLGFAALSFQILLMREFNVHFAGNELAFGVILGFWMFWTGIGSLAASRIRFSKKRLGILFQSVFVIFPVSLALLRLSRFGLGTLPGEIHGLSVMLLFAAALCFLVCFPLGLLFVFITHETGGRLAEVYLFESAGSAAGGLLIYFLFIPILSNWKAAALTGAVAVAALSLSRLKINKAATGAVLIMLISFGIADMPAQKLYWKPFHLEESMDSPYGKLQVLKISEQISLYQNHAPVYFFPDTASAEEAVHFPLLYRPQASRVLLIGGGIGGALCEVLKYPKTRVDYIEIDPAVIQLSRQYLPPEGKRFLTHPRVHIHYRDGRDFIRNSRNIYDVIILHLPPPVNAQLNRFYTQEFFQYARARLVPDGICSFRIPSSENYISPKLQNVLGSLFATARSVFSCVRVIPGESNIFLAARDLEPLDAGMFQQRIQALELKTQYMQSSFLKTRLTPLKIQQLQRQLLSSPARINRDFHPISYFYHAAFQSMLSNDFEAGLYTRLSGDPRLWLLDIPLFLLITGLAVLAVKRRPASFYLFPLALMGLTVIMTEIILIIAFQSLSGYLYHTAALLFAAYMGGVTLGAFLGIKRRRPRIEHLMIIQFQLMLLVLVSQWLIHQRLSGWVIFILLVCLGLAGGDMFIVSNRLYLLNNIHYGAGYGLELMGSFLGALLVSSLLIPLVGLTACLSYLFLAGSACLLFLFWGWKTQSP
jgi:spermidine synthase